MKKHNIFFKHAVLMAFIVMLSAGSMLTVYAQPVFDAVSGGYIEASATDFVYCIDCSGDGICKHCNGKGKVTTGLGSWGCTLCQRSGGCSTCGGSGVLTEFGYVVERNKQNTPSGVIRSGSANDLYACRYCFGTGICHFCSGDGINDTTGKSCVFCKGEQGTCNNCSGYGCLTRDEHNQRIADNTARRSQNGGSSGNEKCTACGGSGNSSRICHTCDGSGKYQGSSVLGAFAKYRCLTCDGSGYEKCSACKGTGKQ